jgi:Outer membrane protein beta-barrel domain
MKKLIFATAFLALLQISSYAQTSFEFVPGAGYTFSDQVGFGNSYGRIDGAVNYGGSFLFNANRSFGLELMYNRMDTRYGIYNYGEQAPVEKSNLSANYIMVGPVQSFNIPGSSVRPYIGAMVGAAWFEPGPADNSSNTKFAWGAQAGVNVNVSPRFGLRFGARLLAPVEGGGAGLYFGNFGGGVSYSGYSSVYQFGLNAGLIIGIGKVLPQYRPSRYRPHPRYYRYNY